MKTILLIIIFYFLISCEENINREEYEKSSDFEVVGRNFSEHHVKRKIEMRVIDSCEYILWEGKDGEVGFAHKGNCKFCQRRLENLIKSN